jgi:hypothetical protein
MRRSSGQARQPDRGRVFLRALAAIGLVAVAVIAVILVRQTTIVLDTPLPEVSPEVADTLPPLPGSVVEAPVIYDLDSAIDSLEAAVPRTYGDLNERIATKRNKRVAFAFLLHRTPFRVKVDGQTVSISADVEYSGNVWYRSPIGPEVEISCGTGGDLPRRATLTLESTAMLTEEWGLRTNSRVVRLAAYSDSARDRCRLTFLRIDVTDRILEKTRFMLDGKLDEFDSAVARWPVRRRFEKIWRDLQKPLRLSDSLYMTIYPSEAIIGSIGGRGNTAFANLRLLASPRITTGPKPHFVRTPLPPLRRAGDIGRGARVLIDASFTYPVATAMLRKALVGRSLEQAGRKIRIRDVRIMGIGGGRVALGVSLTGSVRGRIFFTGTPTFDSTAHQIAVPDLEYDVGTANALVAGYEWLNDVSLRDFLRAKARLPDSTVVRRLAVLGEQGMNRELPARGTRLSGRIHEAGVIAVRATLADIRVRALADADLKLSIDRAPSIPRPPESHGGSEEDDEGEEEDSTSASLTGPSPHAD